MSQPTIVLCFPHTKEHFDRIQAVAGDAWRVVSSSQQRIGQDIFAADIYCGHAKHHQIDWDKVVAEGRLKWIQSTAAGLDHCLAPAIVHSDVVVSGCSGLFARQVAEQTMALLLGLLRSLPVFFRAQVKKEFVRRPTDEIQGKTIGIAGLGGNGQQIARVLYPFGARIMATDCFPEQTELLHAGYVQDIGAVSQLPKMLAESDIVILTLPLTPANDNSFGPTQFGMMKRGSYLINVGRGSVVNHDALVEALVSGQLAGAGLDVCHPEPLPPESPLWSHPNVIITPHVGAQSATRVPVTVALFCENLERFFGGHTLLNLVDKRLGFPRPSQRIDVTKLIELAGLPR
jgi:D-3-phosphoglycerate dehydrogenase